MTLKGIAEVAAVVRCVGDGNPNGTNAELFVYDGTVAEIIVNSWDGEYAAMTFEPTPADFGEVARLMIGTTLPADVG